MSSVYYKLCLHTWQHISMLCDEVLVTSDRGKEYQGIRCPGNGPEKQQQKTGSPQFSLRLEQKMKKL